jgi:polysaccharide deacetylase 2 family uncharacterized protein YibQ
MTLKELQALAKQKGLTIAAGSRRKAIIDTLKSSDVSGSTVVQGTLLTEMPGPEPVGGAALE